jgi:hypothetical protein
LLDSASVGSSGAKACTASLRGFHLFGAGLMRTFVVVSFGFVPLASGFEIVAISLWIVPHPKLDIFLAWVRPYACQMFHGCQEMRLGFRRVFVKSFLVARSNLHTGIFGLIVWHKFKISCSKKT